MRTAHFLLSMMIAVALLQGTSLTSQANSVPQQTASQSRGTSDSSEGQKDGQARSEKSQTGEADPGVRQNKPERGTSHVTQRRLNQSHAKQAPSHQVRPGRTPVASSLRPETLENGVGAHQTGSSTSSGSRSRAINYRSAPVPPRVVGVNGQQFRSSRDPGARLASSGGPVTTTKGTAALNGTNMKRRP